MKKKLEKDGWQDRLAASEWMPSSILSGLRHGGRLA